MDAAIPRHRRQNPKTMTLTYRIWCWATPLEWNTTTAEIAEGLGVSVASVRRALVLAGWSDRVRSTKTDALSRPIPYADDPATLDHADLAGAE